MKSELISWLLKGDPAIRWQVMKDLCGAEACMYENIRNQIEHSGWGRKLLERQDVRGTWGGGLYSPKWVSTTYTMLLLKDLGLPADNAQAAKACTILLEKGFYRDSGINYFRGFKHSETCVTGIILSILSHFRYNDERVHLLAKYCLEQQLDDGGWNCLSYDGATHSSFHTTINVLEGILAYSKNYDDPLIRNAQLAAIEFLLQHHLYKSHRTGKVFDPRMTRCTFPARWRYDILRILDYLQNFGAAKDERMNDAVSLLIKRRQPDGTWLLPAKIPGKVFFDMEISGKPSRWNTLRAMRVLKWWDAA